jgi:hypothetical protein
MGALQLFLLDEKNLAAVTWPDFPGERLIQAPRRSG